MNRQEIKKRVFDKTGGYCAYCGKGFDFDGEWQIDHVIPKSRGGKNKIANYLPCCPTCNIRKYNRTPCEFKEFMKSQIISKFDNFVLGYLELLYQYLDLDEYLRIVGIQNKFLDTISSVKIVFEYED